LSWLVPWLWVALIGAIWIAFALRKERRLIAATARRRPNPTRDEFLSQMGPEVSAAAAEFLWAKALFYLQPKLTPHPDDDLAKDLPIDPDDFALDWPRDFAEQQGFHESNLTDWPREWPATIRNYGRWLTLGPVS
jgi:hypothetical protein